MASQRLLALTALRGNPLPRSFVAQQLWPHLPPSGALASLRTALSRLHAAHPALVRSTPGEVALLESVRVDVHEVEDFAHRLVDGTVDESEDLSLEQLTTPLLPDSNDDWVSIERGRLQELCLHAIEAHAARLAGGGRFAHAIAATYVALRTDPLRESAARTLIETHVAEGNLAQAARCYLEFRERMVASLGIEPSEGMRDLIAPLLKDRT